MKKFCKIPDVCEGLQGNWPDDNNNNMLIHSVLPFYSDVVEVYEIFRWLSARLQYLHY